MPVQISVGPPVIAINQGNTFMVTNLDGEIQADSEQGVFAGDTRFVSHYHYYCNGLRWHRLSSSATTYYSARLSLINDELNTHMGSIAPGTIAFQVNREIGNGINEDLEITNYSLEPVSFHLEIEIQSDFADIFEVRSNSVIQRGKCVTRWDAERRELHATYSHEGFHRRFIYRVLTSPSDVYYSNGRIMFEINLYAGERWSAVTRLELLTDRHGKQRSDYVADALTMRQLHKSWKTQATKMRTSNEDFYRLYTQSVEDLGGLRLYLGGYLNPETWLPAAGVPWYVALFGRDSLIISLQSMFVHSRSALAALEELGRLQATVKDDWRDAQPGKILHEVRFGELAHLGKIPHTPYYGTWDATTLYLITLHETWKWLGNNDILVRFKDVALRCLEWIDKYGDIDGDGFQEYITYSTQGYENMGWKDSPDAIVYPNGSQVKQPKALCEHQGYLFEAWKRCAEMFSVLGDTVLADELNQKANSLQERFEKAFWCESERFYALALDANKNPVPTIASNIGHCMWSGLLSKERAEIVVRRLMQEDMSSGWGIRTLSSENPYYNPNSYHCGSIWPHDNGIIALGFKRYGFWQEAARIARDISEAASFFVSYRLPELYAGIQRESNNFPIQYSGANVPQGWAAGSAFHLTQALLGIHADAPNGRLYVDPTLPHWLNDVELHDIQVGESVVDLRFWREDEQTKWSADVISGDIEVEQKSLAPWN